MAIRPEFDSNEIDLAKANDIYLVKEGFSELLKTIELIVPPGRALSIAVTQLQTACMFAVRGVAGGK